MESRSETGAVIKAAVRFVACVFCGLASLSVEAKADWFGNWPSDARPADISRRIAEQFLSTVPNRYKPENGYRGNNGYGGGNSIHYSVVSLWANALDCARLTGDKPLENRLVIAFEPFYGIKKDIHPLIRVDRTKKSD